MHRPFKAGVPYSNHGGVTLFNFNIMDRNRNENFDPNFLHLKDKKVEITYKGEKCYGSLWFAGINKLLHGMYQVTLNRTPYWPVDPKTIKEI